MNEAATNAVLYASAVPKLRIWAEPGELLAEVRDDGDLPSNTHDPLVGRRLPATTAVSGRGLWLVHQLSDLVEPRFSSAGTTLRMHFALP